MRPLPTWKRVGGKALVHQTHRAGYVGIGKLLVKIGDLRCEQQTLINNGAARKRGNVEHTRIFDAGDCHLTLGALAHHVELPLECVFIGERTTSYKDLLDVRLRTSRDAANGGTEARRIPPAEYRQSLLAHEALQNSFALQPLMFLHRQERHAYAISAGQRQFEAQFAALPHKELMRDLEENAGAIARLGIASAGPAVRQVEQHLDYLAYDFVTLVAANIGYKPDPAGIVLLRRMVEALGGRRTIRFF